MLLGRVIGTLVATVRCTGLEGVPFLMVQPLDRLGAEKGTPLVAADATKMAGAGELILYEGGREAAMALDETFVPVDHAVVGIVDEVTRKGWASK